MTKYKQSFEKCVSKIQKTQDAYKFRREITEITSSINSRVRLWKINHPGPGCSFYEFYEWYIFQYNTRVYIIKNNKWMYNNCNTSKNATDKLNSGPFKLFLVNSKLSSLLKVGKLS